MLRLAVLTVAMFALVAVLAAIEWVLLRKMGFTYVAQSEIHAASVHEFRLSTSGDAGASRVRFRREQFSQPAYSDILLHDLRRPGEAMRLELSRFELLSLAVSPAGDSLAFACGRSRSIHVCNWRGEDHSPRELPHSPKSCLLDLAWSPDGRYLAAVGSDLVCLWRMPAGEYWRELRHDAGDTLFWVGFSGDSQVLLSAGGGASQLWDVQTGRRLKKLSTANDAAAGTVALSRSGKLMAHTSAPLGARELCVLDIHSGERLWRAEVAGSPEQGVAFSADDALLAAVRKVGERLTIVLFDAQTGAVRGAIERPGQGLAGLAFAPQGKLYSWDRGGTILGHDVHSGRLVWRFSAWEWADGPNSDPILRFSRNPLRDRLVPNDYPTKPTVQSARCRTI
jgi:WD40 repeat protein